MLLRFFEEYKRLNDQVLGINRRNLDYVRRYNAKVFRKYVDNKLLNKRILRKHELPYPRLLKVIKDNDGLERVQWEEFPRSFVIKPARGTHGRGIKVFFGRRRGRLEWIGADGQIYDVGSLKAHIRNIISGYFSMGNRRDVAFIEERIKVHPAFKPYSYKGIPDIRVIVFKGIPIMAMLRLPTRRSKGTANLHAGAVAVGIDMRLGITTQGIQLKEVDFLGDQYEVLAHHPEAAYLTLSGIKVPYWDKVLELAIKAQKASKLGYVGVDIAIDRERGPLVLEINARAGLGIQVANDAGLKERLDAVRKFKVNTISRAIQIAKSLFGGEIEEEVEAITGKQIVGIVEEIILKPPKELRRWLKQKGIKPLGEYSAKAKVDTGALYSSIDFDLALKLGFIELENLRELLDKRFASRKEAMEFLANLSYKDKSNFIEDFKVVRNATGISVRPVIRVPMYFAGEWHSTRFTVAKRKGLNYAVLIGRNDLRGVLVDPSRKWYFRYALAKKKQQLKSME